MTTRHLLPPSPAHGGAVPLLLTTVTDVPGPAGASSISTARSTGAGAPPRRTRSPQPHRRVRRLLEITGADHLFALCGSIGAALNGHRPNTPLPREGMQTCRAS
ncbi:hypothetical protein [Kitasatospora arboriphila]|uniref:Uncharacterized protein n=1 Tax=Kitasatospora arboriphila TaxID=258052 RepID=A0ABP4ENT5_9ACTN